MYKWLFVEFENVVKCFLTDFFSGKIFIANYNGDVFLAIRYKTGRLGAAD